MKNFRIMLLSLMLIPVSNIAAAAPDRTPTVTKVATGNYSIQFTPNQQKAIDEFLKQHKELRVFKSNKQDVQEIERLVNSGVMQFPSACWGDFNKDGYLDIVMLFSYKNKKHDKKSGFTFEQYAVVIFNGKANGTYAPYMVVKSVTGMLDVMLYHKDDNRVEFGNSDVATGGFRWNGKKYDVTLPIGD